MVPIKLGDCTGVSDVGIVVKFIIAIVTVTFAILNKYCRDFNVKSRRAGHARSWYGRE